MNLRIETDRLYIRELQPEDAEGMYEMEADPEVHRYLGNDPAKSVQKCIDAIAFIRSQYEQFGIGRWAVLKKENDEFLGWTGFKFIEGPINKHSKFHDFGYRFKSACWRQGFASESGLAALRYGLDVLGLKDVYAMTHEENIGSRKTLEKLGFTYVESFPYDGPNLNWQEQGIPTTWYKWYK